MSCRKDALVSIIGNQAAFMGIHTPLCGFLGTKHPIILAGMGGVSCAELAAAMCNAGGYGVLGLAGTSPELIESQMSRVKELTDQPFGVDLLAALRLIAPA